MMKLKKGFAVAMAAGVLVSGGIGVQTSVFSATAFAQGSLEEGFAEDNDEDYEDDQDQSDSGTDSASDLVANTALADIDAGVDTIPENVNLVIHKFGDKGTGEQVGKNNRGLELKKDAVDGLGKPLTATFEVKKIDGINLKTNQGWQDAEALSKAFASVVDNAGAEAFVADQNLTLGTATNIVTTGGKGQASLPNGLYLVTEKIAPSGYKISVKPFIVALPMTNPVDRSKWLDNVHVYPKNEEQETEEPTKSVKDGGVQAYVAGEKVEYAISQKVVDGDKYNKFSLIDFYPKDRLETPAELSVKIMNIADPANPTEVEALEAADFTGADAAADGRYTITLTDSGLKKVNDRIAVADLAVVATFKMTVKDNDSAQDASEPIMNKFKTITGRENQPEPPTDPTDPHDPNDPNKPPSDPQDPNDPNNPFPRSFYGNVDIVKKASDDTRLAGAEFDLYTCDAGGANLSANPLNWKDANGNNTYDQGEAVPIVTDKTEAAEIKGLLVNDFRDGKKVTADTWYCLKETKAPEGYELLAEVIPFQVLKETGEASDDAAKVELTGVDIVNTKENGGFDLPLTGGKGVFALLLAGAAFLVLGRGYSVYAGRRNKA